MDIVSLVLLILFGAITLFDTLLLIGAFGVIKDQERKMGVIMANYKADLEMTLLNAHNFDEFIKTTESAMQKDENATPLPAAYK